MIYRFNRQDCCIYANPAANLFDIPLNEMIKLSEKQRKNAFTSGKSESVVFLYTSYKGKKYWFDTKVIPECFNDEIVSILVISSDITNLKEAEATLRSSNLYNRSLIEASLDPLVIIGNDGIVTDVNKATERMTGYSRDDLIGTDFAQYLTEPNNAIRAFIHVCTYGELRDCELEIKHRDGHITPVLCNASVYRDVKSKIIGVFVAARDTTELKKVEKALKKAHDNLEERVKERTAELERAYILLKESEELFAEAQKIAHIGSYDWNIVTNVEIWSDEVYRIFGLNHEFGLNHKTFLSCIHPDDMECVNYAINEASNGKPFNIDYKIILPNGEERIIFSQGGVIFDENNTPIRMRGVVQDITERKKAEEAISKIESARKQEIHHRIKNNLQVISSLLDLQSEKFKNKVCINDSSRECTKNSEILKAFKESQDRVISMALIHEELHNSGNMDTINISQYIEELVDNLFLTYRLGNENTRIIKDLEDSFFFDMDIAVPLGLIVNELLSNSLKYAFINREKGIIKIKLHSYETEECKLVGNKSTNIIFSIADNGVGIPVDLDIENLNSLGLQLVTSLVDQIDGELELKRDNGTEFTIKFTVK